MDFEYTVTEPFTMRLSDDGAVRAFRVGDHIIEPDEIAIAAERHIRSVSRTFPRLKPVVETAIEPEPAPESDPASKAVTSKAKPDVLKAQPQP